MSPTRFLTNCLLVVLALFGTACHGHRTTSQHVTEPGVHVIAAPGAQTVVWSDGKAQRACTLGKSGGFGHGKSHVGHGFGHGARSHGSVDAALFRLCEARANGSLNQEQYVSSVNMVLAHMAKSGGGFGHSKAHGECPCKGHGKGGCKGQCKGHPGKKHGGGAHAGWGDGDAPGLQGKCPCCNPAGSSPSEGAAPTEAARPAVETH